MRVLLVAYYYPPLTGGGSQRPVQLVRHLPARGHEVRVLTHSYAGTLREGSEYRVHDPSHNRHRVGRFRLQWLLLRSVVETLNRVGVAWSVYRWWRNRAEGVAEELCGDWRPDLVLATYSPVETLEVGLELARRWRVPLVSDFRDGLLFEPIESRRISRFPCVRRRYSEIESLATRHAAAVTVALPRLQPYFVEKHRADHVTFIPNGFDPADNAELPSVELEDGLFHVVHTGSFALSDAGCDIAPFVHAVESITTEHDDVRRRLRVHQLGRLSLAERRRGQRLIDQGILIDHGSVSHRTCLAYQARADLLLLITSLDRPSVTPGKVFEYLAAGRPILAATAGTFAAEIVRDTRSGWMAHPSDERALAGLLADIVSGRCSPPVADAEEVMRYTPEPRIRAFDEVLRAARERGGVCYA